MSTNQFISIPTWKLKKWQLQLKFYTILNRDSFFIVQKDHFVNKHNTTPAIPYRVASVFKIQIKYQDKILNIPGN